MDYTHNHAVLVRTHTHTHTAEGKGGVQKKEECDVPDQTRLSTGQERETVVTELKSI